MKAFFVDFQGFKDNKNNFIIKELALCTTDGLYIQHWLVKSPYEFKNLNYHRRKDSKWVEKNYHGIAWDDGDITFKNLLKKLSKHSGIFFVKGHEKKEFLLHYFEFVYNIDRLADCPSLKILPFSGHRCFNHRNLRVCSLDNALKLVNWIK
jgi:hypothetical protein